MRIRLIIIAQTLFTWAESKRASTTEVLLCNYYGSATPFAEVAKCVLDNTLWKHFDYQLNYYIVHVQWNSLSPTFFTDQLILSLTALFVYSLRNSVNTPRSVNGFMYLAASLMYYKSYFIRRRKPPRDVSLVRLPLHAPGKFVRV